MTNQVRLDSWKEIATYLKHDERTAQRWHANKGLPVHHVPGSIGSSVFAYIAEVYRWLNSTSGDDAPGASDPGTHVYAFEAMELWGCRSAENICRIIGLSHKAIIEDPLNADAFGILASAYVWSAYGDIVPASHVFLRADMALRTALKLNPRSTSALSAQAWLTLCGSRDQALAEVQFRECLAAFPDQSFALTGLAITCLIQHKFAEATDLANRARSADPLSPSVTCTIVGLLYYMGRFDRVIVEGRIACSIGHASPALRGLIGLAFAVLGQGADAIKELKDAANAYPTSLFVQGALGYAYGIFSHKKEAEAILSWTHCGTIELKVLLRIRGRAGLRRTTTESRSISGLKYS